MLKDIVAAHSLKDHHLFLRFEDGIEGILDLSQLIQFSGIFAPLKDPDYFAQLQIHPDLGTIGWANGADLDPDVLYAIIAKQPLPTYASSL